jgi:hypothetical protein
VTGDKGSISKALYLLGKVALSRGDHPLAGSLLKEGLKIGLDELLPEIKYHLNALASLAIRQSNMERAARLFGAADRLFDYNPLSPVECIWQENDLTSVRTTLGEDIFMARWTEGRVMTPDQAVAYALEGTDV